METGIFYALLSLASTAVNDFVFKLFARKKRPQGLFIAIIGIFWFLFLLVFQPVPMDIQVSSTLLCGCLSGVFSAGGNILLIASMRVLPAGACSTIYRLNLVPVILGAWLFLDETPSPFQWAGAFCAFCAVILFSMAGREGNGMGSGKRGKVVLRAFIMVIAAMLMRAGMGLSYRYGFQHGACREWVTLINSLFWIAGGLLYAFFVERTCRLQALKAHHLMQYGIISGVLVALAVLFMALSLQFGAASVVLPIAQMSFLATWLLGRIFLREKFSLFILLALLCGTAAVLLLSL